MDYILKKYSPPELSSFLKKTFKSINDNYFWPVDKLENTKRRKVNEHKLVQTIVILIKNTTWRCGKLERDIVRYLHKRRESFKNPRLSVKELMANLNIVSEKKDEYLDALRRLEKRNIVKMMPLEVQTTYTR